MIIATHRLLAAGWLVTAAALSGVATLAAPLEFDDLVRCHQVGSPAVSPDGKSVVYVVTDTLKDENRRQSDLWLVPIEGGEPRQLTQSPKHDRHPSWSPDGKWIAFESTRGGESQVYLLPVAGGEAVPLTSLSTGADSPVWSPDGSHIAFVSAVYPEFSEKPFVEADKLNHEKLEKLEKSKVKARVYEALPARKWDNWNDGRRQHLFVVEIKDGKAVGTPRDLTPGNRDAVPWSSTFSAGDEFAFSPDGQELAHTPSPAPVREEAWRTDHDVWTINIKTGERRQLTTNKAADGYPRYSPDGRWIAYRAQARAGFEADRWQLMLRDRKSGAVRSLSETLDASIESLIWSADSRQIVFQTEQNGERILYSTDLEQHRIQITRGNSASDPVVVPGGSELVYVASTMIAPAELEKTDLAGRVRVSLTHANRALVEKWALAQPEAVTVKAPDGAVVAMWIVKPPGFDPARKYPLVFWVHGGPQGAFLNGWSYRWNPELWAAQGYVIALPNPRGSTGYGQKFTDDISRDWGGKVYQDLMAALGWLEEQPWIDRQHMAAAGASYGGYMMNWFQGHTDKFKTLVTHCGVFTFQSMYGATDELWFDEWEHGIPWETPGFDKDSPNKFIPNFKTPNLIIHNEMDFRVPLDQGLAAFTALQRKGIPSKLVVFPDEGHWVLKPQNSEFWHQTIFDWLATYLKK
ncbi:MAG TPA: S9 family peptidase [Candidatus Limnocylindria bacterium]|nr:S9 family peptidase [Candidatus Limnocylindria bacterium]